MTQEIIGIAISALGFLLVFYFKQMNESAKEAVISIKRLNEKVAVVIERTESHQYEIERLRLRHETLITDVAMIKARQDALSNN